MRRDDRRASRHRAGPGVDGLVVAGLGLALDLDGGAVDGEVAAQARREAAGEELRLTYVALTRAQQPARLALARERAVHAAERLDPDEVAQDTMNILLKYQSDIAKARKELVDTFGFDPTTRRPATFGQRHWRRNPVAAHHRLTPADQSAVRATP